MTSVKYDYSHIEEWSILERTIQVAKERQKEIEEEEKKWKGVNYLLNLQHLHLKFNYQNKTKWQNKS